MYKSLLLIALIPAVVFAAVAPVEQCGTLPKPIEVRIEGCDEYPCRIQRGQDAIMDLDFLHGNDIHTLTPSVRATVLGLTIPYPLPSDLTTGCDHLADAECPVAAGTPTTYNFRFPINSSIPTIGVTVELTLTAQDSEVVSCFRVNVLVRA